MAQEVNHIDAAIADLVAWRDQINVTIQTLEHLREKGLALPSAAPAGISRNGDISNDAFFQMTVPDAAEKYLKIVKATKEIPDLAEALVKGGLKSSSKNFTDMVRSVVSRDARFVRITDGTWGLSEWYPGMRKEKKVKPPVKQQEQPEQLDLQHPDDQSASPHQTPTSENAGERILKAMRANRDEEWTATKLTQETGLKPRTVQGTVFRLRHDGRIKKRDGGKGYILTSFIH